MDRYTAFTPTLIRHVTRTGVFIAVVLAVIFVVWRKLPAGFLPEEDQGYVMVMVSTPEASALPVTQAAMEEADAVIRTLPEVASTSFAAGFNMMAGIASTDSGIIFVSLVDFADRKLSAMEIAQKLTDELYVAVPGAECYAFIPPSIPGLGITSGVSVEVQDLEGRGTAYLLAQAGRLMDSLRKQPSIASVTTQFNAGVPQRRLRIDKEQALAAGVDLGVLYGELTTLLGGAYINNFSRFGKLYQTYIQAAPEYRLDKRSLDNYYVASSSGESVPVSSFVEVVDTVGVEYVSQFNLYRSISLTVTPAARASTTTVMQEITRTAGEVLPDDIGTAWSGTSYQEANASKTGGLVYLLALVFVFLALAALYESWGLPLAILMSVPVAVLGAVLFIGGSHLLDAFFVNDVYMQISLVMLIGLAAKNAILVVEYADRLFNEKRPVADGRRDRRRQTARAADHHDRLRVHPRRHAAGIRQRGLRHGTQHHGRGTGGRYAVRHAAGHLRLPGTLLFRGAHREFRTPPRTQKTGGKTMKTGYLTLIFALACAACTPRFYPPKVDVPDGYLYGEGFPRDTAALASDWWRLFGDTVLDNLVQRALENNRDVAVAASRVEEARQNLGVVRAQFLPQVGIGVTAEGGIHAADQDRTDLCRRTVALVGDRPVRAAA